MGTMLKSAYSGGVPAIVPSESRELVVHEFPEPGASNNFKQEPPIEIVIDSKDIREKILQYLGAVLARCWVDRGLLVEIENDAHRALRHIGILLPDEIAVKVERPHADRPRLVIYEYNESRTFKRRICYLQLIMTAGK
ncbi:MAG: hypothetical protein RI997_546 [Pseudomonadota bacterium]|jgi:hypothetical protein